jgi:4-hydroxybenzoate polyprenyltransferase
MIVALFRGLRPHQWVKNAFVVAPLIFGQRLADPESLGRAALAALMFSLLSGSVYLLNDIADVEKDRAHPLKRHRPIASGELPIDVARIASAVLAVVALSVGAWLSLGFAAVAACYFVVNIAYSRGLKKFALLDIAIIALGFLFRIVAGGFAIDVPISVWLGLCTFLLALYLGMGKRLHEVLTAGEEAERQRTALRHYGARPLAVSMVVVAACTIAAYSAYCLEPHTQAAFHTTRLHYTIPFCLAGIARFFWLTTRRDRLVSPTEQIVRDAPFLLNLGLWGMAMVWFIYIQGRAPLP